MMRAIFFLLLFVFFCSLANAQTSTTKCISQQIHDEQVITTFQKKLKNELMGGLKNGAANAITVCQIRAQAIAKELSQEGITVGRASLKPRNHTAVIPSWVYPLLESYQQTESYNVQPQYIAIDDNRSGFVKPIYIQSPCLKCHGENITPEVQKKLTENYPNDQATGYKKGQFRGVFWLERRH